MCQIRVQAGPTVLRHPLSHGGNPTVPRGCIPVARGLSFYLYPVDLPVVSFRGPRYPPGQKDGRSAKGKWPTAPSTIFGFSRKCCCKVIAGRTLAPPHQPISKVWGHCRRQYTFARSFVYHVDTYMCISRILSYVCLFTLCQRLYIWYYVYIDALCTQINDVMIACYLYPVIYMTRRLVCLN